jgi:hypothetical protein
MFAAAAALVAIPAWAVDPALLNLVGPDAKVVGGIHAARTASSPLGQFLLSQINEDDAGFRRFVDATGFDPRRDLQEVLFASAGEAGRDPGLVLARGVFNGPQIYAAAKAKGAVSTQYNGIEILQFERKKGGSLAILDGSLAIAGDEAMVKAAIDRRKTAPSLDPDIAAKVNEFSNRYDAWVVSAAPLSALARHSRDRNSGGPMQAGALEGIEQTNAGVKFGTMVQVDGEAITRSEKDATALVDVVRFLTGMLQLNKDRSPETERLAKLLNSLDVRAEAHIMKFSLSVPQTDLEELLKARRLTRRASIR